jgi:hypothetical protein
MTNQGNLNNLPETVNGNGAARFLGRSDNVWSWLRDNNGVEEVFWGWARLIVLMAIPLMITLFAMLVIGNINPLALAREMQSKFPILGLLPDWLVVFLTPVSSWGVVRYWLPLLVVFLLALILSARYVQTFYGMQGNIFPAIQYIFASTFGMFYPAIIIEGEDLNSIQDDQGALWRIGGPGFVFIRPGIAVLFRRFNQPDTICLDRVYFMRPFETIGSIAVLSDQCGNRDEVWAVTRDGIQLLLKDINFSYRLSQDNDRTQSRSIENPYPFSEEAMMDFTYNLSAGDSWEGAVRRFVVGEITSFISSHEIDYLTAPRKNDQEPRLDFRNQLFTNGITQRLKNIGTELLWIDVGHVDILEVNKESHQNVDGQRFAYWASSQIGIVNAIHAKGDADRIAYQERGRVEAQAELLKNITASMEGFDQTGDPAENLRKILLVRTAQILEGLGEAGRLKRDDT